MPRGVARALRSTALAVLVGVACAPDGEVPPRHVVLVSLDTLSASHVGAYGYPLDTTPNLDHLAAQGVLFEHAYTNQSWTLTAHASLLTGLYADAHGAGNRTPIAPGAATLGEVLEEAGFHTEGLIGNRFWLGPRFGFGRGFARYRDLDPDPLAHGDRLEAFFEAQAAQARDDAAHRFFLFLHYYEPHSDVETQVPYWAPEPYGLHFLDGELDWKWRGDTKLLAMLQVLGYTERDREVVAALYDGGVRYTDRERLGRVLAALREAGLAGDTLVVVTSDHGEEIFEHGAVSHQQPYEEIARVPLVMRGPGLPDGVRVPAIVELVDVMPTVLSLLAVPAPAGIQGRDLTPLIRGERLPPHAAHLDGLLGTRAPYQSRQASGLVVDIDGARWSYVGRLGAGAGPDGARGPRRFRADDSPELYHLGRDPEQTENLADAHPGLIERLEARLLDWYAENEAARARLGVVAGDAPLLGEAEREQLEALGYAR